MTAIQFRPWKPKGSKVAVRFYIEGSGNGAFIGNASGVLKVSNTTPKEEKSVRQFLVSHQIDIDSLGLSADNLSVNDEFEVKFKRVDMTQQEFDSLHES